MFTIIIVDDFFVERENVKDIIDRSGLALRVMGEFSNGVEAMEFLKSNQPDFVLADIEMPFMNGIELIRNIKEKYPDIRTIIFSFHDKFEYVKKALNYDVFDYILKPVIEDEMITALEKLIKKKREEQNRKSQDEEAKKLLEKSKPLLIEKLKREVFYLNDANEIKERFKFLDIRFKGKLFVIMVLEIDDFAQTIGKLSYVQKQIQFIKFQNILSNIFRDEQEALFTQIDDIHWAVLLGDEQSDENILKDKSINYSEKLIYDLEMIDISISIGLSDSFENLININNYFRQAILSLEYKFIRGKAQIIKYEDVCESRNESIISIQKLHDNLRKVITSGKEEDILEFISEIFKESSLSGTSTISMKYIVFSIMIGTHVILDEMNIPNEVICSDILSLYNKFEKYETLEDMNKALTEELKIISGNISYQLKDYNNNVIKESKKFIKENYNNQISVQKVADSLNYSANYLNNLFKQETDETILEYITRVRMRKACEYLTMFPEMKVYEICKLVGYSQESYFRSLFKKHIGCAPKEYRGLVK